MHIDMGDVPGWTAFVVSGVAVFVAIRANRHARDSADASKDSAVSARRSADAAERQAEAQEKALPPPPPLVAWEIEHLSKQGYALRNVGLGTAAGVKIDLDRAPAVMLDDDEDTIPARASLRFLIAPSLGQSTRGSSGFRGMDSPCPCPCRCRVETPAGGPAGVLLGARRGYLITIP
jgi:hypothetical protein